MANPAQVASCPHRPPCPGCPRFGESGIAAAASAALEALARSHALPAVPVIGGASSGFRHRARLAIRGRVGSPKVGLFEHGSHRVVHVPSCRVHHPLINRVAGVVRRALAETQVSCYSDKAHLGLARHLQVVVERRTQTAQVVLVANSETPAPLAGCLDLIRQRLAGELHSLWFNAQRTRSNTVLGPDFERWSGQPMVVERFAGADVHYPPGAFGQNNLEIADLMIAHVRSQIPPDARVAEFYAGVGAIGLSLLDLADGLCLNEINPQSLLGLDAGIAGLAPAERAKVSVVPGAAGSAWSAAADASVVIADPPRKGLDAALLAHLQERPPERFIYVSCGLDSLIDDVARLTAGGALRLTELRAFNLLPFTDHVEAIARFERR